MNNLIRISRQFYSSRPKLADLVCKLRSETAFSLDLCRKALIESNLDYSKALETVSQLARTSINSKLNHSSVGKEGILALIGDSTIKHVLEIRSDSDFVANHSEVTSLAKSVLIGIEKDRLLGKTYSNLDQLNSLNLDLPFSKSVRDSLDLFRAKFRENIVLTHVSTFEADQENGEFLAHYIHQKLDSNVGKSVSIVKLYFSDFKKMFVDKNIANDLAKQVAACKNSEINNVSILDTEFAFEPVGSVRDYLNIKESIIGSKIMISDVYYRQIK